MESNIILQKEKHPLEFLKNLFIDYEKLGKDFPFLIALIKFLFPEKRDKKTKIVEIDIFNADDTVFYLSFFSLVFLVLFVLFSAYTSYGYFPFLPVPHPLQSNLSSIR